MAWLERIKEAKSANNVTVKQMSERIGLPAQTIERILAGKTRSPYIDTVLDLGAAVAADNVELKVKIAAQEAELDLMRMKLDHKEQIIALHDRYVRVLERDQK